MEGENIFDLAFLFGLNYVMTRLNNSNNESLDLIFQVPSKLKIAFKYMIRYWSVNTPLEDLSKFFNVSTYILDLIGSRIHKTGICNICDKYYIQIRRHLRLYHNLSFKLVDQFGEMFSNSSYFYLPSSVKDVDIINESITIGATKKISNGQIISCKEDMKKYMAIPYFAKCMDDPNLIICVECGKIVSKSNKRGHLANHRKYDPFECAKCGLKLKRNTYVKHLAKCGLYRNK